jgi:hypothetical protein
MSGASALAKRTPGNNPADARYARRELQYNGATITATRLNGGNPVFSVSTQNPASGATASPSIYWPWIIDARALLGNSALDEFYLYYSTDHDTGAGGIWLATGPTELGPWTTRVGPTTTRGEIYVDTTTGSQSETPSVIPDPTGVSKLIMFYQQVGAGGIGVQSTLYATSNDGITWTRGAIALDIVTGWPSDGHTGYLRPHLVGRQLFAYSLAGGGDYPKFGFSRSYDGRTFTLDSTPLYYQMDLVGDGRRVEWNSGDVLNHRGVRWWVGLASNFTSGSNPKDARLVIAPLCDTYRSLLGPTTVLLYPTSGIETTNYRAIRVVVTRTGRIILYYQCDAAFYAAELTIGG